MSKKSRPALSSRRDLATFSPSLDLEDADELCTRSRLGFHIHQILTDQDLRPRDIATLLGIKRPDVSHLAPARGGRRGRAARRR